MSDNKRTRRGNFGKGYYIALILCAAAIGITGYVYYRNANRTEQPVLETSPEATVEAGEDTDVAVIATTEPGETQSTVPTETTQPKTEGKAMKTTWPVSGNAVAGFAMETLSYNETTRDWRTHNGLDIAAPAGTEVVAAADGEVYTIYEDDAMGVTVVIRHLGGYTTQYSSLDAQVCVSVGDQVTMGQVIGKVGTTALVETAMGEHVHFAVTHQDVPMDPLKFLAMN